MSVLPLAGPARGAAIATRLSGALPLLGVLALALALRLTGLGWSLPWALHPDEIFYVDQAQDILKFGDLNPKYFKNPSLLTYLLSGELQVARLLGMLAGPFAPDTPGGPYLLARLNGALSGVATVAVVFALGRRLAGRRCGLIAALLLAVSFLHVRDSHYGVNDVPATFLLTASLYCAARIQGGGGQRWYLLAGLLGGLATSTKYNMGFFFVSILVAHASTFWGRPPRGSTKLAPLLAPLALAGLASLAGYLLATPYTVLDWRRFSEDFLVQYRYGNSRWLGQPLDPVPLLYLTSLLQGFGLVPLLLAGVGLTQWWRRQRSRPLLLLAFPLVYLAFLLPKELFFPRFTIPLLPILSLLAAFGLAALAAAFPQRLRLPTLTVLLVAALAQPLSYDLLHNRLLTRPDTRILANLWVQEHLPRGSRVKVEDYSLRDLSTQSRTYTPNRSELRIERFEGSPEADSARAFFDRGVQYVVTSSFASERYLLDPPTPGQRESGQRYQRLHTSLERRAELLVQFSPGHTNEELPYRLDDVMTPLWSLEQYERPGPTIRVYSLAPLATAP